jgi:hypothetical protein
MRTYVLAYVHPLARLFDVEYPLALCFLTPIVSMHYLRKESIVRVIFVDLPMPFDKYF